MGIVVKCFQSEQDSVQSLQSPHPTYHIFNFTTFPIGHTPNTNAPCQCHQNAPSPSEATPLKPPQGNVLIKRPQKTEKPDSLTTSSLHRKKKRATCTSQLPLRRLKSMSMLPPPNSLPQLPVPNIALFGKYHLQFHKSMASRMPRNA